MSEDQPIPVRPQTLTKASSPAMRAYNDRPYFDCWRVKTASQRR